MFEGAGFYDLSPNLSEGTGPGWKAWPAAVLAGKGFYPGGRVEFAYFNADQQRSYYFTIQRAMDMAAEQPTFYAACYLGETAADLALDYLVGSTSFINSPLTDQLKSLNGYDSTIYLKAVRHCWDILNYRTRSIADLPRDEAWSCIALRYSDVLDWLIANSNLPRRAAEPH